jgi:hypothetical protein
MDKDLKEYLKIWMIILIISTVLVLIERKYGFIKNSIYPKPKESNYSPVEYANYPNLTGNPVADIAILNQAGFRYDH